MPRITVATLNILHNLEDWPLRVPLIVQELIDLKPEVVCLQECLLRPSRAGQITDALNRSLGGELYRRFEARRTGWLARIEGIAVVARLPVVEEDRLPLRSGNRVSQRIRFSISDGRTLDVVNNHFHHPLEDHQTRTREARSLVRWLASHPAANATVIAGDLNAEPEEPAIRMLKEHFASVFDVLGIPEPVTYGTPYAEQFESPVPQKTIDYILISPGAGVEFCRRAFERPHAENPHIYASDHYGLVAGLVIP
jgi:endonuclease/exonuclease/phosphatase family metal-dependent hydrolase